MNIWMWNWNRFFSFYGVFKLCRLINLNCMKHNFSIMLLINLKLVIDFIWSWPTYGFQLKFEELLVIGFAVFLGDRWRLKNIGYFINELGKLWLDLNSSLVILLKCPVYKSFKFFSWFEKALNFQNSSCLVGWL